MRLSRTLLFAVLLTGAAMPAAASTVTPDSFVSQFAELTEADRQHALASFDRAQLQSLLAQITPQQWFALARRQLKAVNTYQATLIKRERVGKEMLPDQTMDVTLREEPLAARINYVAGPSKGRRVLYNVQVKPREIRVKEAGLLGWAGGIWLDIDSSLTRADTNHPITDLGLGALVTLMEKDVLAAAKTGPMARTEDSIDAKGRYCAMWTPPAGATGTKATKTRVCYGIVSGLPEIVEVHDAKGMLERYEWRDVKKVEVDGEFFTVKGAGL